MSPASALRAYQSVRSESMAHGGKGAELVVMLYDGILESLSKIKGHTERKEWREAGQQYARALTILAGLRETLDHDRGEPVASHLLEFYNSVCVQILKAQNQRDLDLLQKCIDLIANVRDSWGQLAAQASLAPVGVVVKRVNSVNADLSGFAAVSPA
jgi:flagellar protein FliS